MSAYHQNVLVERFVQGGGELPHSVVVGIGGDDWYEDIKALRRRGCRIERDGNRWFLDLDELPVSDVGRAGDHYDEGTHPTAVDAAPVAGSPDIDPDGEVEGEPALFEALRSVASHYDVEAA